MFVRTKFERTVGRILLEKGYEAYVPCQYEKRKWMDRIKITEVPLFPNYVFCRFAPEHKLPILTTPDVYSIVGAGKHPTPVPFEEIYAVQRMLQSGVSLEAAHVVGAGEPVRVIAGPLKGLEGTVMKIKNSWRLVVTVTLLQRGVAAEISRDDVERFRNDRETRDIRSIGAKQHSI